MHATGQVLAVAEVDAAYEEMQRVAAAIDSTSRVAARALGGLGAAEATRVEGKPETDSQPADGVPSWLRQQYRKALAKVWSDHMPIAVRLV